MRLNDCVSTPISSLLFTTKSGASMFSPWLTWSASLDSCVTGRITMYHSIRLSATKMNANTAVSDTMKVLNAALARAIGTSVGTDTICAPITSFSFQPKPLAGP